MTWARRLSSFGRLLRRIEKGKGEAYGTRMDVRYSDRNRIIAQRRILIATSGSATADLSMFTSWLAKVWFAFMDESQQYSRGPFMAAMFLLVFWILFSGPW